MNPRVLACAAALTLMLSGCTNATGSVYGSRSADADERYHRMLENARVHDTDGFLLDGENARHDTVFN